MNFPLISVVLPCYNVSKYLEKCITSLVNQTYQNLEIIIVDDGSTDETLSIAEKIASTNPNVKVFHKENGGVSSARNYGISKVTGLYFSFVDPDDYVLPNYIEELYEIMISSNTDISFTAHNIIHDSRSTYKGIGQNEKKNISSHDCLKEILLDQSLDLCCWGKLYKTSLFQDILFPVNKNFEDTAITYKIIMKCNEIAVSGNPLYNYYIRSNSITTSIDFEKKYQLIENTNEMCNSIKAIYPDLEIACNRRLVWAYFSTLNQLLKSNQINFHKDKLKEIKTFLLSKKKEIISHNEYKKSEKAGIILLSLGLPVYNFVRKIVF